MDTVKWISVTPNQEQSIIFKICIYIWFLITMVGFIILSMPSKYAIQFIVILSSCMLTGLSFELVMLSETISPDEYHTIIQARNALDP